MKKSLGTAFWLGWSCIASSATPTDSKALSYLPRFDLENQAVMITAASDQGVWRQDVPTEPWHAVRSGDTLPEGALVMTDTGSDASLEIPAGRGLVRVAGGSVVQISRTQNGTDLLLMLTAGLVAGEVRSGNMELASSCGGNLSVTAPPGSVVPFQFRHGRDSQYLADLQRLGLESDWVRFQPSAEGSYAIGFGAMTTVPGPERFSLDFETVTLLALGTISVGLSLRQRNDGISLQ